MSASDQSAGQQLSAESRQVIELALGECADFARSFSILALAAETKPCLVPSYRPLVAAHFHNELVAVRAPEVFLGQLGSVFRTVRQERSIREAMYHKNMEKIGQLHKEKREKVDRAIAAYGLDVVESVNMSSFTKVRLELGLESTSVSNKEIDLKDLVFQYYHGRLLKFCSDNGITFRHQ